MSSSTDSDRALRSVFIGNIPYDLTEEKLKEVFSDVGQVISLKLVFDRDSGKPKGYGFCEYKDEGTAGSAIRHLNNFELNGRVLRVDNAGAERSRMAEIQQNMGPPSDHHHQQQQQQQHHRHQQQQQRSGPGGQGSFHEPIRPESAPEAISQAVASLPPEQMYDMMKQMKLCIQNNPLEARQMLIQNPQLAYALLQAQVVMKIVDPQVALSMLIKDNQMPMGGFHQPEGQGQGGFPGPHNIPMQQPPQNENPWITAGAMPGPGGPGGFGGGNMPNMGMGMPMGNMSMMGPGGPGGGPVDMDLRQQVMDPRQQRHQQNQNQNQDFDFRGGGGGDPRMRQPQMEPQQNFPIMDPRSGRGGDNRDRDMRAMDRDMRGQGQGGQGGQVGDQQRPGGPGGDRDMRRAPEPKGDSSSSSGGQGKVPADPRSRARGAPTVAASITTTSEAGSGGPKGLSMAGFGPSATDQEKAALIMQVLQLSEEQIALFPAEQRQSILTLKEQISKSGVGPTK